MECLPCTMVKMTPFLGYIFTYLQLASVFAKFYIYVKKELKVSIYFLKVDQQKFYIMAT